MHNEMNKKSQIINSKIRAHLQNHFSNFDSMFLLEHAMKTTIKIFKKKPLEDSKPLHRNTFPWTYLLFFISFPNIYLLETNNCHLSSLSTAAIFICVRFLPWNSIETNLKNSFASQRQLPKGNTNVSQSKFLYLYLLS